MPSYTVFELSESDQPLADHLIVDQAFALICDRAGFKPVWTREGFLTTLELRDQTGAREIPPRTLTETDPAGARRKLMQQALGEGIWGFYAVPDMDYQRELRQAEDFARAQRRKIEAAVRTKVVPIGTLRDHGLPLARFDGDAVWRGKPDAQG